MNKRTFSIATILSVVLITLSACYIFPSAGDDLSDSDKNGNGIWDDYEIALSEKYKNSPNLVSAAIQTGKSIQDLFDISNIFEKDKTFARAMSCLVAVGIENGLPLLDSLDLIGQVRDIVISNDARQLRYIKYNAAVSGHMLPVYMPDVYNCDSKSQGGER